MSVSLYRRLFLALVLCLTVVVARPALCQDDEDEPAPKLDKESRATLEKIDALQEEAVAALTAKKYDDGIAALTKILDLAKKSTLPRALKDRAEGLAHYNLCCAHALKGNKAEAVKELERSFESGLFDWEQIEKDSDLDGLRGEETFKAALAKGRKLEGSSYEKEAREALAGKPLFDFAFDVKTIDGKSVKLADLKGKVVIVDVWGTWCPPCKKEIPHFVKLYDAYKAKGLEIVGLACERVEDVEKAAAGVKEFCEKNGVKYPVAVWSEDEAHKSIPDFRGYPTTLFIDRDGKVRLVKVGYENEKALEGYVQGLLSGESKAEPKKESF